MIITIAVNAFIYPIETNGRNPNVVNIIATHEIKYLKFLHFSVLNVNVVATKLGYANL
jgi:hypothetical protein